MIKKMEISGVHAEADERLKKYIVKTINKLERYMPRHARKSVHVEVKLKENKRHKDGQYTAEVIMYLPNETLAAKESTINMYAAVDIVEAKLQNQLKRYKEVHSDPKFYRRLTSRFRQRNPNQI